jgi:ribonuclease HIII
MASESHPVCFVTTIDVSLSGKLKEDLLAQGFELSEAPHAFFSAKKKGISCVLYLSGKLTVQGKDKDDFIAFYLEPEILKNLSYTYPVSQVDPTPRAGLDESGKGDFFGPLCFAGVFASEEHIKELVKLGVKDSKKMSDEAVLVVSQKIKKTLPYKILRLFPETYNQLYVKFHNLNRMMAWGHATVLEDLITKTQCKKAILDQFAPAELMQDILKRKKMEIDLVQRFRAEEDPVVAAASILARAAFLEGLQDLSERIQVALPKGASSQVIEAGKKAVRTHGPDILTVVSKSHFKTTATILHD